MSTPTLIIIILSVSALLLYVVVLIIEHKRGGRFFESLRARLDSKVSRLSYGIGHIAWGPFFGHMLKLSIERIAHDIVHGVLLIVRTIERTLTRAIRVLRERLAYRSNSIGASGRFELTRTVQRFRKTLKGDRDDQT